MRREETSKVAIYCKDKDERGLMSFIMGARLGVTTLEFDDAERLLYSILRTHENEWNGISMVMVVHSGRDSRLVAATASLLRRLAQRWASIPVLFLDLPAVMEGAPAATALSGVREMKEIVAEARYLLASDDDPDAEVHPVAREARMVDLAERLRA